MKNISIRYYIKAFILFIASTIFNILIFNKKNYNLSFIYLFITIYLTYYILSKYNNINDKIIYISSSLFHKIYEVSILIFVIYKIYIKHNINLSYIYSEKFVIYDKFNELSILWTTTFYYYIFATILFSYLDEKEMLIHHLLSILSSYILMDKFHCLSLIPLIASIPSVSLNLILLGYNNKYIKLFFAITFTICKIIIPTLYLSQIYHYLLNDHKILGTFIITILMINYYWFYKLIKKIFREIYI
jgi:hypothetical protein